MMSKRIGTQLFFLIFLLKGGFALAQTTLISSTVNNGGFESLSAGWTIVNGTQTNKWWTGTTAFCSGSNGAFVGVTGTSNTYDKTMSSVVHLYRDFTFPAGESQINLTFKYRGVGESSFDYLRVYVVSTATTPVAGTQLAAGQVGNTYYNQQPACTNYSITLNPTLAGTTQRLVFSWRNDGSLGTDPAATLDDVTIITQAPGLPNCATLTAPANGATGLCNTAVSLNWTAPATGSAPTGYKIYLGTNNPPSNLVNGTNVGNVLTYSTGPLTPNTTYYWQVVPNNSAGDALSCPVQSFSTGSNCFIQTAGGNFNGCSGNFYDPGGPGANYPNSNNSVSTICPSSPGQYVTVTFNSFNLESCCDNLKIYDGNSTAAALIGTFTGTTLPTCISSTTSNGCLAFQFTSDGSVNYSGWDASVSCTSSPSGCLPSCAPNVSPLNGSSGICTGGLSLNWNAPSGGSVPTGYKLFFGTNNPPTNIVNGTNVGNVLTYNPGALATNTTYYWKIVPSNATGDATGCSVWSFTTGTACFQQSNGANYSTCGGTYYDSGGPSGNYSNNENSVTTICPSTPGQFVQLNFTAFNIESCCDDLNVYNGNTTTAPLIGNFYGTSSPCVITSSASNGCLTMQFTSDGSVTLSGWQAAISCVTAPASAFPGSTCGNAPFITLPYSGSSHTTACYGNDYSNASAGSCGSLYESGEDRVYAYVAPSAQCLSISINGASTSSIGYQVYDGCPGVTGSACIGSNGGSTNFTGSVSLPGAGTYYIIVDTWASPANATYSLSVSASTSVPSNDIPCNAISLPLAVNMSGNNACSGFAGEPAVPSCWTGGVMNTVWYSVVAPASGQLKIRTTLGTNTNTQIAVYSGPCSGLTLLNCNQNAPSCGSSSYDNSELTLTGLASGATYFIRVDGADDLTGTFDIMAVDGAAGFPPAAGQECISPNPVCDTTISIGNPGYQAYGNSCDFAGGGGNCLLSGERGSAWYSIPIAANGTLEFNIIPNDWPGAPSTSGTDYDFAIWKISGSGATTCSSILTGAVPLKCNYSFLGVTGLSATGNAPAAYPGFDAAYESSLSVNAGDVYVLVISNHSNSTSGFTINFNPGSPIAYTGTASSVVWSGGTNTNWILPSNWGGCSAPICGINATISPSSLNQPVLPAGTYNVNNLTIDPGASLTLQAGSVLNICGNYTNFGSLIANPGATIAFVNNANQTVSGALTGVDRFPNLLVNKSGGSVTLNNDIDVGGDFTTSNNTSVFNSAGKIVRVAGHFSNANGNSTFSNTGTTGTLEFNGTSLQNYNQGLSQLDLNFVAMKNTGSGVNLLSHMNVKPVTGTLTLNTGKIVTSAYEVRVYNRDPSSVTPGNVSSYVQGFLRRWINSTGSYDFPVGEASKGYERANIVFNSNADVDNLLGSFVVYPSLPGPLGLIECNANYNMDALNDGKWIINAFNSSLVKIPGVCNYNMTLYNRAGSYSNSAGAMGWTIMKDVNGTGLWTLDGTCVAASTVNMVMRTGMAGFSHFGTAQSTVPLPIELISFTGWNDKDFNVIEWVTSSEINNEYFTLLRSGDGLSFEEIVRVAGSGNSSSERHYEYVDQQPLHGVNYYQLKQTDYDGQSTFSDVIAIKVRAKDFSILSVRPNPSFGQVFLDFSCDVKGEGRIRVTDLSGRIVWNTKVELLPSVTTYRLDLSSLTKGIYSISVISSSDHRISVPEMIVIE